MHVPIAVVSADKALLVHVCVFYSVPTYSSQYHDMPNVRVPYHTSVGIELISIPHC